MQFIRSLKSHRASCKSGGGGGCLAIPYCCFILCVFFSLCLALAFCSPVLYGVSKVLLIRDEEQDEGLKKKFSAQGGGKKIHLSQDLKETKSSKYSQVIPGGGCWFLKFLIPVNLLPASYLDWEQRRVRSSRKGLRRAWLPTRGKGNENVHLHDLICARRR